MRCWPEVVCNPRVACGCSSRAVKEIYWLGGVTEGWLHGLKARLVPGTLMPRALLYTVIGSFSKVVHMKHSAIEPKKVYVLVYWSSGVLLPPIVYTAKV